MTHRRATIVASCIAAVASVLTAACSSDEKGTGDSVVSVPIGSGPTATSAPTTTAVSIAATTSPEPTVTVATVVPGTVTQSTAAPSTTTPPSTTLAPTTTLRPSSTTPPDPSSIGFVELGRVASPTNLAYRNGDRALFVVSRDGYIVAMRDGAIDDSPLLDIADDISAGGEQGLLGLAFSTDGSKAYVNYTNTDGDTEITEYAVGADGSFDAASKRLLIEIDQPYSNHNGGQVRIGPDGYLFIGMGDGGSGGDPERYALNVASLLGKMLRIDPNPVGDSPYSIPPDNPFIGVDGARAEIWSVGLRNPWRFSFDLATRDLWIADVGQGQWEEINAAWADEGTGSGVNFGWSAFEGTHRFNTDQPAEGSVAPIFEYEHGSRGCSISGGVRYRGELLPDLYGWYVYADYCNGEVRALQINDDKTAGVEVVLTSDVAGISEVAQGPDGELYVLSVDNGRVYAMVPA